MFNRGGEMHMGQQLTQIMLTYCAANSYTLCPSLLQLLMESSTFAGVPPSTYGVVWSKYEPERMVTYGQNHIKFWVISPDPKVGPACMRAGCGCWVQPQA